MQIRSVVVVAALGLASFAHGQQAVQWRVEDGGNGHWYGSTKSTGTWDQVVVFAQQSGGQLACIASSSENNVVRSLIPQASGYWIGGRKLPGIPWEWVDGSTWSFTNWCPGEPCCFDQGRYVFMAGSGCWDDHNQTETLRRGAIEWSADCNGDGVVDYGQILDGTFEDVNSNGVPDCCDDGGSCEPCPGDVNDSGIVNATDIAVILGAWGTNGGKFPRSDTDGNGIVDAADLAVVLGGWGNCP
jgi:hypothetical protein